jgi:cell division protein FtsZ
VIPNERLLAVAQNAGFFESFRVADDILRQAVQGISDIITIPGIINRDFADVKTIMQGMGHAVMGTAVAKGERRAIEAAQAAISSPLLEEGAIDGARGILINITGSSSLKLAEVNEASTIIQSAAHEDANIIFGAVQNEKMEDAIKITVIATGFKSDFQQRTQRSITSAQQAIASSRTAAVFQPQNEPPAQHGVAQQTQQFGSQQSGGQQFGGQQFGTKSNGSSSYGMPSRMAAPARENPTIAMVTDSIKASVEQDDLDVPAFIRKRGEIN